MTQLNQARTLLTIFAAPGFQGVVLVGEVLIVGARGTPIETLRRAVATMQTTAFAQAFGETASGATPPAPERLVETPPAGDGPCALNFGGVVVAEEAGTDVDATRERYLRAVTRANYWAGLREELHAVVALAKDHAADPARLGLELGQRFARLEQPMGDADALVVELDEQLRAASDFPNDADREDELAIPELFDPDISVARKAALR